MSSASARLSRLNPGGWARIRQHKWAKIHGHSQRSLHITHREAFKKPLDGPSAAPGKAYLSEANRLEGAPAALGGPSGGNPRAVTAQPPCMARHKRGGY